MRIGILGHKLTEWGGGLDFLRMICGSLHAAGVEELHFFVPSNGPLLRAKSYIRPAWNGFGRILGRETAVAVEPSRDMLDEFIRAPSLRLKVYEIDIGQAALRSAAKRAGIDVLLPAMVPLDARIDVPWLGYIADFQHLHLPSLFSAAEILRRNEEAQNMLLRAPAMIVNARSVAADIRRFLPGSANKVFTLPFSAAPDPAWFHDNAPMSRSYGVAGDYFIICNQFWRHKDHLTAYRALAKVRQVHPDIQLVCTGQLSDFRHPDHAAFLAAEAERLGIGTRLHVLGMVPKRDQIALLRGAIGLLQPTLFEGGPGGGSVYDAVSLGVPAIVSDIPVNLEIDEPGVAFFHASDADALAARMLERLHLGRAKAPSARELLAAGALRRARCGQTLLQAISRA